MLLQGQFFSIECKSHKYVLANIHGACFLLTVLSGLIITANRAKVEKEGRRYKISSAYVYIPTCIKVL